MPIKNSMFEELSAQVVNTIKDLISNNRRAKHIQIFIDWEVGTLPEITYKVKKDICEKEVM